MKTPLGSFINHVDSFGGRGTSQMTILYRKPYLVKVTTKGGGGQKYTKNLPRGLWMTPSFILVVVKQLGDGLFETSDV